MTQFKGFELFDDIELSHPLKQRNRAVVLSNIAEDNTKNKFITPKGASLILGYFDAVPHEDRSQVNDLFMEIMKERGYA